jgi:hypothetical protein
MPKNEKGLVKISKLLFNPETSQDNTVDVIAAGFLGEVIHNYSEENKVLCKNWCKNLKIELSKAAKLKIIQEMIKNAQTFGYPWMVIQDIQEAWLDACLPKQRDDVGKKILQCSTKGYFRDCSESLSTSWKYTLKGDMMRLFNLVYLNDKHVGRVGCIARQASRSKNDVLKRIMISGKKRHHHIATRRAAVASADTREQDRKRAAGDFTSYVRPSIGKMTVESIHMEPGSSKKVRSKIVIRTKDGLHVTGLGVYLDKTKVVRDQMTNFPHLLFLID